LSFTSIETGKFLIFSAFTENTSSQADLISPLLIVTDTPSLQFPRQKEPFISTFAERQWQSIKF